MCGGGIRTHNEVFSISVDSLRQWNRAPSETWPLCAPILPRYRPHGSTSLRARGAGGGDRHREPQWVQARLRLLAPCGKRLSLGVSVGEVGQLLDESESAEQLVREWQAQLCARPTTAPCARLGCVWRDLRTGGAEKPGAKTPRCSFHSPSAPPRGRLALGATRAPRFPRR